MQILPAIDIRDGRAVRLFKGDFDQETVVNSDVVGQARIFGDADIAFLHVVDLDGALDGRATNRDLIAAIKVATGVQVQVGGGIRTDCDRDTLLIEVEQTDAACHTGAYSCFFEEII